MPLRHDIRRGALCMLAAHLLFTCMSAMVKELGGRVPFVEVMFFRSAFALPVVGLIVARSGGWTLLRTRRFPGHVMRAITGTVAQGCSFFALTVLSLAEQTALGYTTPLFVTILAIPLLGEKVGVHRWSAVLLGFCGVLVIAMGQGVFHSAGPVSTLAVLGTVAAVSQGFFSALTTLLVRQLSATESSTTIVLWQSVLMTAFTLLVLPFIWVTPGWADLGMLILVGLVGGAAQWLLTEAYASAQVSALGPYSYSSLLWSIGLGWMLWGDVPAPSMLAGAALIVAAGLYILHRELVRRRQAAEGRAR
ncbi:MAG: DMT family transporter [Acetobacteraceae bacterium]|nr:DMT family transporter [Acetobacteraceae bacterium]MDI3307653.1 DMT family transporter [Acetobacteraceae bacterium]